MSIIPEIVIQRTIINGLKLIKTNPKVIDNLFINLDQTNLSRARDFLINNTISFAINYQKQEALKVPALVLTLQRESESEVFLGNMLGTSISYKYPDQEIVVDTLGGHAASISTTSNLPAKLADKVPVLSGNGRSIEISLDYVDDLKEAYKVFRHSYVNVHVVGGTGAGQVRRVSSMNLRAGILKISEALDTPLDATSLIDLRAVTNPLASSGEPTRLYTENEGHFEKTGRNFDVTYNLTIAGSSQYEVLYLYAILKAILLAQVPYLEKEGLQDISISGSEFAPRGDYLPDVVYTRSLNITFKYTFGFISELGTIKNINLAIIPLDHTGPGEEISGTITL